MAAPRKHLPNAPITEAVVDFRVEPRPDVGPSDFERVAAALAPGYVNKGAIFEFRATLAVVGGDPTQPRQNVESEPLGLRLHSDDERYVLQVQRNGFTLSRLHPYETWERLLAEAQRLWPTYVAEVRPESVTRVATRFINNLQLPLKYGDNFEKFLVHPPQVPDVLPQSVTTFLQRYEAVDQSRDLGITLTLALPRAPAGEPFDKVPIILDIDVYRPVSFAPTGTEQWDCLNMLRATKNQAFFGSLTEEAIALYI